jgi:molecular chaperone GrpE
MADERKIFRIPVLRPGETPDVSPESPAAEAAPVEEAAIVGDAGVKDRCCAEAIDWRDKALRMQAEMEAYRRRQDQRADTVILEEQMRLLRGFLGVTDNLEQALAHLEREDPLYLGVRATYDGMLHLLRQEGVEPLATVGGPFDPQVHEAVAVVPPLPGQEEALLVVEELRRGYRKGSHLLRPARVVVASKQ